MKTSDGSRSGARNAFFAIATAVAFTLAIWLLPNPWSAYVSWPLLLFSTYAHEMGHGLAALLVGGTFSRFEMWANASGMAHTATTGALSGADRRATFRALPDRSNRPTTP